MPALQPWKPRVAGGSGNSAEPTVVPLGSSLPSYLQLLQKAQLDPTC